MKIGAVAVLWAALLGPSTAPEEVDFSVLSGFDYIEGKELPGEVERLHETEVTLAGFMQREDDGSGPVEYFMLIDDACGCEGTPKLNEIVFCAMPEGETTDILAGVTTMTGKLFVEEIVEDDVVVALYTMDVDSIDTLDAPSPP
ncbi:MAG: DUF3299 domain-containing protein [Planctomycetota bacterium]